MNTPSPTSEVLTLLACASLLFFVYTMWCRYQLDRLRHELFCLRYELFDFAAQGGVSFGEPSYGILRLTLNGTIRYAHEIGFLEILTRALSTASYPKVKDYAAGFWDRWESHTARLTPDAEAHLTAVRTKYEDLVVNHLILTSPFFFCVFVMAILFYVGRGAYGRAQRWAARGAAGSVSSFEARAHGLVTSH